jgi:tetratricopeptide (TPR) repeat protein
MPVDRDAILEQAETLLRQGKLDEARVAFTRIIAIAPDRRAALLDLAGTLAREGSLAGAFVCTEVVVDDAVLAGDWDSAVGALQSLVQHGPYIPALVKLVDVAADAGREEAMQAAQAQLADAYLDAGRPDEARVIAEALLARTPPPAARQAEEPRDDDEAIVLDMEEIDLSDALADLGATPAGEAPAEPAPDLDAVFEQMRARAARQQPGGDGSEEYERGLQQLEQGQVADAIASLRAAARRPLFRFRASARLGRLLIGRGEMSEGIEWLERAAEAPAPAVEEGWSLLYDLADALERTGESGRALAVLLELEADAGDYRHVRGRIELLSRAQAGKA